MVGNGEAAIDIFYSDVTCTCKKYIICTEHSFQQRTCSTVTVIFPKLNALGLKINSTCTAFSHASHCQSGKATDSYVLPLIRSFHGSNILYWKPMWMD